MTRNLPAASWRDFNVRVFTAAGVPDEDAQLAADVRLESALRQGAGIDVFSIRRLQNTVRRLQAGGINPSPQIAVVQDAGHHALLDGDNGLGSVVGTRAMQLCLDHARAQGLALVGVRNSTTLGMMAYYAMLALPHQAIGFAATNTELKIGLPPWGGETPALGNNPFAVAIPAGQGSAVVLDMSVIATAPQATGGELGTSSRAPLGSGFMSRPVIGDHKGYGLALVLEVLTGVLTGAGFGQAHAPEKLDASGAHHDLGHLFGVLNPAVFMPQSQFLARMEQLRQEVVHTPRVPGVERIYLPGELEHERRETRLRDGIPVHDDTPAVLQTFCDGLGIPSPLPPR
jgi:LDH2 family malate/lactate/ureidoglycolate dehydrogenase